ncbi:MAG TPA: Xaa-Pro peptidase family protein [Candidatus Limnocylindrales bacterium]
MIETFATRSEPTQADYERWRAADRLARPHRLEAFRERLVREGVGAYFGIRRENVRYLAGLELGDGEEKVAGYSGHFLVSAAEVVVMADSRYTVQVRDQCPDARIERVYNDLYGRWPELLASIGSPKRVGVEAAIVSHAMWHKLAEAAPGVELVPADGWVESLRQVKEPAELERVAASSAVADLALERLLPSIRPGMTEHEVALQLEFEMRTHGAEALAFDVAVLAGPNAALPHGSPGPKPIESGQVLLFDFGAQVCGYRSDMTRTLFVGEPGKHDLKIYEIVARAQQEAIDALAHAIAEDTRPTGKSIHMVAKEVIDAAGYGDHFGHGLGHGIGLATHELPSLGLSAGDMPLPSPTVFSVEPGIYLEDVMGVRIEDLMIFDAEARSLERITLFPREVTVIG